MIGTKHWISYCTCWLSVMSWYFDFTTPDVPHDLRDKVDVRCVVTMNVSAFLIFLSSISIMLRPTQAEGEFHNVLIFSLIEFKSRFRLSYFVYPNLTSNCVGWHPKLCVIIGLNLLFVLLFSSVHKDQILKLQFDKESEFAWVCSWTPSVRMRTKRSRRITVLIKPIQVKLTRYFMNCEQKRRKLLFVYHFCIPGGFSAQLMSALIWRYTKSKKDQTHAKI